LDGYRKIHISTLSSSRERGQNEGLPLDGFSMCSIF